MTRVEALAHGTCHEILTARDLAAICHHRGLAAPGGGKEALAAFVAPRLLSAAGAARAMASLEARWLAVLHAIAIAGDPPALGDLRGMLRPRIPSWELDDRAFFRVVTDGLLSRGVVLVEDRPSHDSRASRFARLSFHFPEALHSFLPPYPVDTLPLRDAAVAGDPSRFFIQALRAAIGEPSGKSGGKSGGKAKAKSGDESADPPSGRSRRLLDRLAAAISFDGGGLLLGKAPVPTASALARLRREWLGEGRKSYRAFRAAAHILAHLPPERGLAEDELREALSRIGLDAAAGEVGQFLEDGFEAGFLERGAGPVYAAAKVAPPGKKVAPAFFARPTADGVEVDLDRTDLGPLLDLAAVSRVEAASGALRLVPDIVLLGRAAERLPALEVLLRARACSRAFDQAAAHVEKVHGSLIVHEGLVVLRVEDLGLRTLLARQIGPGLRQLGGPYLAIPRALAGEVEKIVRKEGFAPRPVS